MPPATTTKDFDAIRAERRRSRKQSSFKLHDQTFFVRSEVRPDVITKAEEVGEDETARGTLELLDDIVLSFIDPKGKAHEKYREARADEADPITLQDIFDLIGWLVEVYTGRPTEQSSPSAPGRAKTRTGTRSTGASRSKAQGG